METWYATPEKINYFGRTKAKKLRAQVVPCRCRSFAHSRMGCKFSSAAGGAHATTTANPLLGQEILAPFLPVYRAPARAAAAAAAADAADAAVTTAAPTADEEALRGLARALEASDACGRWCAEQRAPWGNWGVTFHEVSMGLRRLQAELEAVMAAATPAMQAHLVATTVRAAQVWRAFEGFSGGGNAAGDVRTARALAAAQLVATLHGRKGQGPARAAATAQCEQLGAAMDAAWFAFPAAEREALRALPWENDSEPLQVGVWEHGTAKQNGEPIFRPKLRQRVPEVGACVLLFTLPVRRGT